MGKHTQRSKRLVDSSAKHSNAVGLASLNAEYMALAFGLTSHGLDVRISMHDAWTLLPVSSTDSSAFSFPCKEKLSL